MLVAFSAVDFYREQYLRRLHEHGYPATPGQLALFNVRFYDELRLRGEDRSYVSTIISNFNRKSIRVCFI